MPCHPSRTAGRALFRVRRSVFFATSAWWIFLPAAPAQTPSGLPASAGTLAIPATNTVEAGRLRLQDRRGVVEVRRETGVTQTVDPGAELRARERVRTAEDSSALILGARQAAVLGEATAVDVVRRASLGLSLRDGKLYLKSIGPHEAEGLWVQWGDGQVVELSGTELHLRLDPASGQPVMEVLSGVPIAVPPGITVHRVGQGEGELDAFTDLIQWVLYYPPVLELAELESRVDWHPDAEPGLVASLGHYRAGDLARALATYPAERTPSVPGERLYRAALALAAGQLEKLPALLGGLDAEPTSAGRLARALRRVERAVKFQRDPEGAAPDSAAEWLAESYYQQSLATRPEGGTRPWEEGAYGRGRSALEKARRAAERAVAALPESGFALARLADLEFSFGETRRAETAVNTALVRVPRHAPAFALRGFLRSAQNRFAEAAGDFATAIELDGKLGTAWLGQGLIQFRQGRQAEGLTSLQMAVMHEPQRALFRSYLAKGYYEAATFAAWPGAAAAQLAGGEAARARWIERADEELAMARTLDPHDPTPDLYAALLDRQRNRINAAVVELERSKELNDNRRLQRSGLLLDQDQAVRGANLASIYRDAGMVDWSVQEASRAVQSDYANFSAHLFLANSYDALRDPTRFNLRYETPWFHELLLANLLSPVGAGVLSQNISQQEYARLFDRNRLGLSSTTEYLSDGRWRETASHYGMVDSLGYALDVDYQHNDGVRENNDLSRLEWHSTIKYQLSPQDAAFLLVRYQEAESGDNFQYADPRNAAPDYRFAEQQQPTLVVGYHHEWSPGHHTLFLGGRLQDAVQFRDTDNGFPRLLLWRGDAPVGVFGQATTLRYENEFAIYTANLEQLWTDDRNTLQAGVRYQVGDFETRARFNNFLNETWDSLPRAQSVEDGLQRFSTYVYATREILRHCTLTAGVSYDDVRYPGDYQRVPLTTGEQSGGQVSPKVGVVWSPTSRFALRSAYSRSLGGVSFDQSYTLEPVQLAGFTTVFRSLLPEGPLSVPTFDTAGLGADWQPFPRTYLTVEIERLQSGGEAEFGAFQEYLRSNRDPDLGVLRQQWDYVEHNARASVAFLMGEAWSVGVQYQFSRADLESTYPTVPTAAIRSRTFRTGDLHRLNPYLAFHHSSGLFGRADWIWHAQNHRGEATGAELPSGQEDVHQLNLLVGYRFPHRRAELAVGVLNVGATDYQLDPINLYSELPRERTLLARLKLNF